MNTTETQPKIFEVDQIVSAGINGHPRFFKVVKLTAKTVWFQELVGQLMDHDGYGQAGNKLPTTTTRGEVFSKRIKSYENGNTRDFIHLGMVKLADMIHMTKCLVFRTKICLNS